MNLGAAGIVMVRVPGAYWKVPAASTTPAKTPTNLRTGADTSRGRREEHFWGVEPGRGNRRTGRGDDAEVIELPVEDED